MLLYLASACIFCWFVEEVFTQVAYTFKPPNLCPGSAWDPALLLSGSKRHSTLRCSMLCSANKQCRSLVYNQQSLMCDLYDQTFGSNFSATVDEIYLEKTNIADVPIDIQCHGGQVSRSVLCPCRRLKQGDRITSDNGEYYMELAGRVLRIWSTAGYLDSVSNGCCQEVMLTATGEFAWFKDGNVHHTDTSFSADDVMYLKVTDDGHVKTYNVNGTLAWKLP